MSEREGWNGEALWDFAKGREIGRRQFLWLMASGGASAVVAA